MGLGWGLERWERKRIILVVSARWKVKKVNSGYIQIKVMFECTNSVFFTLILASTDRTAGDSTALGDVWHLHGQLNHPLCLEKSVCGDGAWKYACGRYMWYYRHIRNGALRGAPPGTPRGAPLRIRVRYSLEDHPYVSCGWAPWEI